MSIYWPCISVLLFIFMIACGLSSSLAKGYDPLYSSSMSRADRNPWLAKIVAFLSGCKSVQVFIVCLYMYFCWRSSYQKRRVGIPLTSLTSLHFGACPKPGPGFPTSYVMGFFVCSVSSVKLRGVCFVDICGIDTIQYNKLYLKSENIKHYNTSSNELLNST